MSKRMSNPPPPEGYKRPACPPPPPPLRRECDHTGEKKLCTCYAHTLLNQRAAGRSTTGKDPVVAPPVPPKPPETKHVWDHGSWDNKIRIVIRSDGYHVETRKFLFWFKDSKHKNEESAEKRVDELKKNWYS